MVGWCGRAGVERSEGCGMDALLGSRTATLFWVVFLPPVGFLHGACALWGLGGALVA